MLDFTDVHTAEIVGRRSVRGEITSVQYVITDSSTVECTAELRMEEQVRVVYAARSLESAELDETTEPEPCCAAVYYASSGEKVWDIAKRLPYSRYERRPPRDHLPKIRQRKGYGYGSIQRI